MIGPKIFAPGRLTRQIRQRYGRDEDEEASAEDLTAAAMRMRARYGLSKDGKAADAAAAEDTAEKDDSDVGG